MFIFLGPPACGKGTQSAILVKKHGLCHLSTGDMIRAEIAANSELGLKLKELITTGNLVDDAIVNELVQKYIAQCGEKGVLFDGYPRTLGQADFLEGLLDQKNKSIKHVFYFDIDSQSLLERIAGRVTCEECKAVYNLQTNPTRINGVCDVCGNTKLSRRSDDNEEILKKRIGSFFEETTPLKDFYQQRNLLTIIDARMPMVKVTEQIEKVL